MESHNSDLAPLLARRELWLLVSACFVDPYQKKRLELLRDGGFRTRAKTAVRLLAEEYPHIELGPGEVSVRQVSPAALFAALDAESDSIEQSYRGLFGLTVSEGCPPCGIEYERNTDITYRSQQMADIAAFYNAFGLEVSGERGERLDHVTVEAEFLYLLNAKEAAAVSVGIEEQGKVCRSARKKFFQEHVGWWLPAFARLLMMRAPPSFYRLLADLTASLSAIERASLELAPFAGRVVPNTPSEAADATCFECAANQSQNSGWSQHAR